MRRFYLTLIALGAVLSITAAVVGGTIALGGADVGVVAQETAVPDDAYLVPDSENPELVSRKHEQPTDQEPGVPAITVNQGVVRGNAAFAAADVVAYLKERPHRFANLKAGLPRIEAIEFVSASEANKRIEGNIDLPDDALVCLVTMRGEFIITGPPGTNSNWVGKVGRMVFDAQTGNLLTTNVDELERQS